MVGSRSFVLNNVCGHAISSWHSSLSTKAYLSSLVIHPIKAMHEYEINFYMIANLTSRFVLNIESK